jgi:hypothetical protein
MNLTAVMPAASAVPALPTSHTPKIPVTPKTKPAQAHGSKRNLYTICGSLLFGSLLGISTSIMFIAALLLLFNAPLPEALADYYQLSTTHQLCAHFISRFWTQIVRIMRVTDSKINAANTAGFGSNKKRS